MEFWVGILIGMHIGKFLGEQIEVLCEKCGLISHETHEMLDQIEDTIEGVAETAAKV